MPNLKRLSIALVINNWDFFVKRGTPNPTLHPNLNPKKERKKKNPPPPPPPPPSTKDKKKRPTLPPLPQKFKKKILLSPLSPPPSPPKQAKSNYEVMTYHNYDFTIHPSWCAGGCWYTVELLVGVGHFGPLHCHLQPS